MIKSSYTIYFILGVLTLILGLWLKNMIAERAALKKINNPEPTPTLLILSLLLIKNNNDISPYLLIIQI